MYRPSGADSIWVRSAASTGGKARRHRDKRPAVNGRTSSGTTEEIIVKRLAFLSVLGTAALVAAPALADDGIHVEHAPNPGFVYELAPGSGPGTVTVRIRNGASTAQTIYRNFPTVENRFDVSDVDPESRHVRRRAAPAAYGRVTSSGITLSPGETAEAQVDLNQLFVLTPGHRYRVKAATDLRFGPADRVVLTSLRANEITIGD
ncbi:MAG TPA: hypothetical protein VHS78_08325 [Candidatus Elarobacter sp.]|nr:hypothetical protein [Candidatus Elarobacter sp.]